jgi:agmatinase
MQAFIGESERFLGLPDLFAQPEHASVIISQVPFEATSTYGKGSDRGPKEILSASHQVELYDAHLRVETYKRTDGIATLAPLELGDDKGESLSKRVREITTTCLEDGKRVVTLGGEHTSVVGAIKAHAERYPDMTILHLDAHSDLRNTYEESPWNHACTISRIADFHEEIVQVGIRSQCNEERLRSEQLGFAVFYGDEIHDSHRAGADWIAPIVDNTAPRVYVTFDCDVLDPSILPATGTPEPGGLDWYQVNLLFSRLCKERQVVGFDISELSPIPNLVYPQFTIAKLIYRILGYVYTSDRN